ncbi:MAG: glycoside hydrolase family 127 protein [Meiothermus sp.]|nr:glycoside hydrolase family 127 protein [Meiothermus sp.]
MADSVPSPRRRYRPLPLGAVGFEDQFWAPRLRANRQRGIAFQFEQLERIGAVQALDQQPRPLAIPWRGWGTTQMFWDSDLAKWIEAASYSLATYPDPALEAQVDDLTAKLAAAQQPDGYLNTFFTAHMPDKRFTNERDWHETYCAGHLVEAAVAHFEATGKRTLLEVMERYVDLLASVYGPSEGQKRGYPGHEELELALLKLYRATGKPKYLEFARYLVDERGRQPHFFDLEALARGDDPAAFFQKTHEYSQAHRPVREQDKVVGHAVRAMYLYTAMADLSGETGDAGLMAACERLWADLTTRRLYVTGGLGPSASNEGFTADYDLPNETAYAETCASIGLVFWARQMLEATGQGRYADLLEHALYNNVLAGVSPAGDRYFYENVLQSAGADRRWEWHVCPCCPPNLLRLLMSLGQYAYGQGEGEIAVHLYAEGRARLEVAGSAVTLHQTTRYPWDGSVSLKLELSQPAAFTLRLRIPGWCEGARVFVNDVGVALAPLLEDGYASLHAQWKSGDEVRLELPMPAHCLYAHPAVRADAGQVALQRGPILYCLEAADNPYPLHQLILPENAEIRARLAPDLLGGAVVLEAEGLREATSDWNQQLYRSSPPKLEPVTLRAVPYSLWANREPGEMRVWIRTA